MAHAGRTFLKPLLTVGATTVALCTGLAVVLATLVPAMGGFVITWVHAVAIGLAAQVFTRGGLHAIWRDRQPHPAGLIALCLAGMAAAVWTGAHLAGLVLGIPIDWLTRDTEGIRLPALLATLAGTTVLTGIGWVRNHTAHLRLLAELEQTRAAAAARLADEAQLRLLRAQLEPHMLFNTLATLRALIGQNPARAQDMLDRIVSFMRATLDGSRTDILSVKDEFNVLDDYLGLMAIRLGSRLSYRLLPAETALHLPMPALLLQPLIENAVRHGIEPAPAGGHIEVRADIDAAEADGAEGPRLRIAVSDTGVGFEEELDHAAALTTRPALRPSAPVARPTGNGFGLDAVRARLGAAYGDQATLNVTSPWPPSAHGGTLIELALPIRALDAAPATASSVRR